MSSESSSTSQPHSFLSTAVRSPTDDISPLSEASMDLSHSHAHPNETRQDTRASRRSPPLSAASPPLLQFPSRERPHVSRPRDSQTRRERYLSVQTDSQLQPIGRSAESLRRQNSADDRRPQSTLDNADARRYARELLRTRPPALGTREDVQDPNYESPVATMFTRAWGRYNTLEQRGRQDAIADVVSGASLTVQDQLRELQVQLQELQERQSVSPTIPAPWLDAERRRVNNRRTEIDAVAVLPPSLPTVNPIANLDGPSDHINPQTALMHPQNNYAERLGNPFENALYANALQRVSLQDLARELRSSSPPLTFDTQDRPSPRSSEEMIVDMACKICREQTIDIVLIPCMHACMCHWCADIQVPVRETQRNLLRSADVQCPMCRRRVRERRGLFV